MKTLIKSIALGSSIAFLSVPAAIANQGHDYDSTSDYTHKDQQVQNERGSSENYARAGWDDREELRDNRAGAREDLNEAIRIIQDLQNDRDLDQVVQNSKGILVIPDYVTAALIAGGTGGEGVLLKHNEDGSWSNPVFYDLGKASIGLQAGVSAGSIAMVLMSDQALNSFKGDNTFSLSADAGFSLVNWSERGHGEIGQGDDVIVWTDTEGLFGEASVGVSDITWDDEENKAFYGEKATADEILNGNVKSPAYDRIQNALASD